MLARFVPWGARDVEFRCGRRRAARPVAPRRAEPRARVSAGSSALAVGLGGVVLVGGLSGVRAGHGFGGLPALRRARPPQRIAEWTTPCGLVVSPSSAALATAGDAGRPAPGQADAAPKGSNTSRRATDRPVADQRASISGGTMGRNRRGGAGVQ